MPALRFWLRGVWAIARPLVLLRTPPLLITVLGALTAVGAIFVGPWWALLLVMISVACDALDGAVAVLSARVSAAGAIADRLADRIADCAFAAVLWRCGAPWPLAVVAAGSTLLLEGWREIRRGPLLTSITVAERPTRAICVLLACLCAGLSRASWPPTVCAAVWVLLTLIALGQFALSTRGFRGGAGATNAPSARGTPRSRSVGRRRPATGDHRSRGR